MLPPEGLLGKDTKESKAIKQIDVDLGTATVTW